MVSIHSTASMQYTIHGQNAQLPCKCMLVLVSVASRVLPKYYAEVLVAPVKYCREVLSLKYPGFMEPLGRTYRATMEPWELHVALHQV
jgi:hypothetical protein